MADWLTPDRRNDPELMDAPGLPEAEVADAYRILERVNRQFFGGRRPLRRELAAFLQGEEKAGEFTLLDVGSGSGDLARYAREILIGNGVESPLSLALDRDPTAIRLAAGNDLPSVKGDALRLPLADRSVDLVLAVKFAHHFRGQSLTRLVAEMARVGRSRVIVLDIRRSWLAYWGFVLWSRVFTRNRLVRFDGPLSVLRGFTRAELLGLAAEFPDFSWQVRPYVGFQLALVGTRLR